MTPKIARDTKRTIELSAPTLRRRLSGDLDNIVLMALRKEPSRRYASVGQFAEDLRRHLEGLPVSAVRGSWSYRAGKFIRRHKVGIAAISLVLLAVAIGVVSTIREARIAAANQKRAEERFNDVRKLANSLMFEIHDAIRDLPGSTPARKLLVNRALEYLDNLGRQSKGDASLQKEMAAAYDRVGDVLGYPYAANLGDHNGALESYHKALAIRESLLAASPKDSGLQLDMVRTCFRLAQVLESVGNFPEALAALKKAAPIAEKLAANSSAPDLADNFAGVFYFTGLIQVRTGDPGSALQNYQHAAMIRDAALRKDQKNFFLRTHLAADYGGIALCYEKTHDLAHAVEVQAQGNSIIADLAKSDSNNATISEFHGEGLALLADYQFESGDARSALNSDREAYKVFSDLYKADPKNALAKANVAFSNMGIARSLSAMGKRKTAIDLYREAIATFEEMSPRTSGNRYPRSGLASASQALGAIYSVLAAAGTTPTSLKHQYWTEAESACKSSVVVWKDKEKRGEMETGEQESADDAAKCVAQAQLHLPGNKRDSR